MFKRVNANIDLPSVEAEMSAYWDRINAFETSMENRKNDKTFRFYDGPPFPTGSPHYGNLLAGVIKDIVPRYWTMRGYYVERRFGWDVHGLPIEMEVQKKLNLEDPQQIDEYGIGKFNEACRSQVQTNTDNWEKITRKIGRWVDFENEYNTMDIDFMESVWWVFKELWSKGLIYQDYKVLPYSWAASTPLSNFEANMDYRDVEDPSIYFTLDARDNYKKIIKGDKFLVWTTTPWCIPGNLAIAVGKEIEYSRISIKNNFYWIATERLFDAVNGSSVPANYEIDEFKLTNLSHIQGKFVDAPYVKESPAALECKYWKTIDMPGADRESGKGTYVVFGKVLGVYIDDEFTYSYNFDLDEIINFLDIDNEFILNGTKERLESISSTLQELKTINSETNERLFKFIELEKKIDDLDIENVNTLKVFQSTVEYLVNNILSMQNFSKKEFRYSELLTNLIEDLSNGIRPKIAINNLIVESSKL